MIIRNTNNKWTIFRFLILFIVIDTNSFVVHSDKLDEAIASAILMPSSSQCQSNKDSSKYTTTFTDKFFSSDNISHWSDINLPYEQSVFEIEMSHMQPDNKNKTWYLRIGKGGQIISLRGLFGESIANQANTKAVWNDLVTQTVSVHQEIKRISPYKFFIHGSGTYAVEDGMPPAFYNPNVAMDCSDHQCTVCNWGQQAHIPTIHRSDVLYCTKYKDCGNGVIEYDQVIHHYGLGAEDKLDWMNTPWTGIRTSTFRDMMIANRDTGKLDHLFPMTMFGGSEEKLEPFLQDTGGFTTFTQDLILKDDKFTHNFCIEKDYISETVLCKKNVNQRERNRCADVACGAHKSCYQQCTSKPGLEPFKLIITENNSASTRRVKGEPREITLEACSLNAPITKGLMEPDKGVLLFTNSRTGFQVAVNRVRHWCWKGKTIFFQPIGNVNPDSYNRQFKKGDEIIISYKDDTTPYQHDFCVETNVPELELEKNCVENDKKGKSNPARCANVFCGDKYEDWPSCECKEEEGMEPLKLVVQKNNGIINRTGAFEGLPEVMIPACSVGAPVRYGCEWCGNPVDGLYFTNSRNGYTLEVSRVGSWCWGARDTIVSSNVTDTEILNKKFRKGDEILITYNTDGKPNDSNLALTFVHGTNPEYESESYYNAKSRMRYGIASVHRDGTVWTTNFLGNVNAQETYFNRKYMIIGNLNDVEKEAKPLVNEAFETIAKIDELNPGETITLYYKPNFFGATIGDDNDNVCAADNRIYKQACVGSTTPKSGSLPLFYITCGKNKIYVGHDSYKLSPNTDPYLKPYYCDGKDVTVRPTFKLLGFFPINSCRTIETGRPYDAEMCPTITDKPSTEPSIKLTSFPTASPTIEPSNTLTAFPTVLPTIHISNTPTSLPTSSPTIEPSNSITSLLPVSSPTSSPEEESQPSNTPSSFPTTSPTYEPSNEPSNTPISSSPASSPTALTNPEQVPQLPLICPRETDQLPAYQCLLNIPNQVAGEECALCKWDSDCNENMICTGPTNHYGIYYCVIAFATDLNCRCYRKGDCLNSADNVRCRVPQDGTPEERYCLETEYTGGSIFR